MKSFCRSMPVALFMSVAIGSAIARDSSDAQDRPLTSTQRLMPCIKGPNPAACTTEDLQQGLIKMIWAGRKDDALQVIARLSDVNFVDRTGGFRPLSLATQQGQSEIVSALLRKGADPLTIDRHGQLVLYEDIATVYSRGSDFPPEVVQCVRIILDKAARLGRLPPNPPLDLTIVFFPAAKKPSLELLQVFLAYGAEPTRLGRHSIQGNTALDAAIARDDLGAVRIMVGPGGHITQSELDKRAFDTLMKHKPELLAVLRSGGADPARYMNANPKILFDVVRDGGVETLSFLLENGANPNIVNFASRTPIFETRDPEKLRLLLEHGADPNFRKDYDYTALSNILFIHGREISVPSPSTPGQKPRVYSKASLVKLFLDHGVDPNADHGDRGLYGALGNTRREDKDVINLLIERGATLTDRNDPRMAVTKEMRHVRTNEIRGALTIAIDLLERDDLALALVARDGKVGPEDQHALLGAVRRGWREVGQALLRSGADPNVADNQGITPLAMAERRRDTALIKLLVVGGATPSSKSVPRYKIGGGSEFEATAATKIDDVVFFDPPRFDMGASQKAAFVLYGNLAHGQSQNFESIQCESAASFMIIAHANDVGQISVGVCNREAARLRELAANAKRGMGALLDQLAQDGMKIDRKELARTGWVFEKKTGPNHSEIYYFPVILIGHGILDAPTVVLVSEKRDKAVVVQASVMRLCGEGYAMQNQTPLCSDTKGALTDIAQRLFVRFGEK